MATDWLGDRALAGIAKPTKNKMENKIVMFLIIVFSYIE